MRGSLHFIPVGLLLDQAFEVAASEFLEVCQRDGGHVGFGPTFGSVVDASVFHVRMLKCLVLPATPPVGPFLIILTGTSSSIGAAAGFSPSPNAFSVACSALA